MRKLLFTAILSFTMVFALSSNSDENGDLVSNSALATGTCCPEPTSKCITRNNGDISNYYGKPSGSCNVNTEESSD